MLAQRSIPIAGLALLTVTILLLHLTYPRISAISAEDDDLEGLDELLAIDEELEREKGGDLDQNKHFSEAGVVSRAQRIVVELSDDDAMRVVEGNEHVLLLGYTPWCERSANLMPRFAGAATALRDVGSGVVLAKLDCERHAKAAAALGIRGFPSLLLFVNGTSQPYKGGFSTEEIITWTRKRTGEPTIRLPSIDSAEEFLANYQTFIIGLFENYEGPEYAEFLKAAVSDNEIQFAETKDIRVAEVLYSGIREDYFLGLVKSEPERFLKFENKFEEEKILQFIELNKFPLVTELTEVNSNRVYSSLIKLQVFVISELDDFKNLHWLVQDVARKYISKIMLIHVNSEEENLAKPILTLFGIESDKPVVIAFDNRNGSKYLLQSDITISNLENFCNGLLKGSLQQYFRSEPIPETKGAVEKVVGRTFDRTVLESHENVLLEVHTPWCMECKAISNKVEKLANHFKGWKNLIIARINAELNEHPRLQITSYPAVLFYPSGDKSNPIKLSKKSGVKEWIEFIKKSLESRDKLQDSVNKDEL